MMGIYKDQILDHAKGNDKGKGWYFNKVTYSLDNIVGATYEANHHIVVVIVVIKNCECNVTTQR